MRDLTEKTPNPQGKGQVAVLSYLHQPALGVSEHPYQVLLRYLFSRLVLRARFAFQPTCEQRYTLYWHQGAGLLSMISPTEFGGDWPSKAVADCQLNQDYTWQCLHVYDAQALATMVTKTPDLTNIDPNQSLRESLPYCDTSLAFTQRALAYGMSHGVAQQLAQLADLPLPSLLQTLAGETGKLPLATALLGETSEC